MKVWVVTEERETRSGMTWLSLNCAVASLHRMEAGAGGGISKPWW